MKLPGTLCLDGNWGNQNIEFLAYSLSTDTHSNSVHGIKDKKKIDYQQVELML